VGLTYKWYETENLSHWLIAEKLNAYELVLPHGTKRHFRTKRCNSQGGPQPIIRSTVREILSRIFWTGQVPYYGTNEQGIRLKRRNIAAIVSGQHPPLISRELFDHCQQLGRGRLGKLSMAERISQSVPFVGEPVRAMVCG